MVQFLVLLVIAGVVIWLVNTLVPMDPKFKMVFNAIIGIALLLWVLSFFGLLPGGTFGVAPGWRCR